METGKPAHLHHTTNAQQNLQPILDGLIFNRLAYQQLTQLAYAWTHLLQQSLAASWNQLSLGYIQNSAKVYLTKVSIITLQVLQITCHVGLSSLVSTIS